MTYGQPTLCIVPEHLTLTIISRRGVTFIIKTYTKENSGKILEDITILPSGLNRWYREKSNQLLDLLGVGPNTGLLAGSDNSSRQTQVENQSTLKCKLSKKI